MIADIETVTAVTAKNQFVEAANGVTYAYRQLGAAPANTPPLVLLQHFRGNLDNWDPLLIDNLAAQRSVVLVDNAGVGLSSGTVPSTVIQKARDAIAFIDALDLSKIDVLGYSIGGMVAQELALLRPQLVRRLILAATGPRGGGEHMHGWITDIATLANADNPGVEEVLRIFFSDTETSRQRGMEYLRRRSARVQDQDKPTNRQVRDAQYDAIVEWGIPEPSKLARLAGIRQPTLVANGDNDTMIPTVNTHILGQHLPNARVRVYSDAGHGFLFQWPTEFADLVNRFLA
jgi:pimeloyl-ACP methyl ester carboxylesterase